MKVIKVFNFNILDILFTNFSKFGNVRIDWPKKTPAKNAPPEG